MADRAKAKSKAKSRVNEAGNTLSLDCASQSLTALRLAPKAVSLGSGARKAQMMAKEYKSKGGVTPTDG